MNHSSEFTFKNGILLVLLLLLAGVAYYLYAHKEPVFICSAPMLTPLECDATCIGECQVEITDTTYGILCMSCIVPEAPVEAVEVCPQGFTSDKSVCDSICTNGACYVDSTIDTVACYTCAQCSDDAFTTKELCENSCDMNCYQSGSKENISCWKCLDTL